MSFVKSLFAIAFTTILLAGCAQSGTNPSSANPPEDLPLSQEMRLIRDKAGSGDLDAMFELGAYYAKALNNIKDDSPHAVYWLERAAKKGHIWAQNEMGVSYRDGRFGVATDFEKAFAWFKQSADNDETMAQFNIGRLYRDGRGTHRDLEKSLIYMELAASNNNPDAVYSTSLAYEQGMGTAPDMKKYTYYTEKSLMKGYNGYNFFICEYKFLSNDLISDAVIERMFLYYYTRVMGVDSFDEAMLKFVSEYLYADDFKSRVETFLSMDLKLFPQVYKIDAVDAHKAAFIDKTASSLSIYSQADKEEIEYEMVRVASLLGNRSAQQQLSNIYKTGKGIKKSRSEAKYWAARAKNNIGE